MKVSHAILSFIVAFELPLLYIICKLCKPNGMFYKHFGDKTGSFFFLLSLLWNPFKTLFISKLLYFVVSECIGATQKTIVNQGQYISGQKNTFTVRQTDSAQQHTCRIFPSLHVFFNMFMLNHELQSDKCKWDVLREKVEFQINCSKGT